MRCRRSRRAARFGCGCSRPMERSSGTTASARSFGPDPLYSRELADRTRPVPLQAALERVAVPGAQLELLGVEGCVGEPGRLRLLSLEELADAGGRGPHRLVADRAAAAEHPGHVRHQPVRRVHYPVEVVDEDRARDAELVAQPASGGELVVEAFVRGQLLARVRLPRVDDVPADVGVLWGELVEQRTLCGAVRSGEGAELEHDALLPPQLRQAHAPAVEQRQLTVGPALARVQHVREGAELAL